MTTSSNTSNNNGVGFFGLLTIVFIVLKLTKVVKWTWPWILAPLWIPLVVAIVVVTLVAIFGGFE